MCRIHRCIRTYTYSIRTVHVSYYYIIYPSVPYVHIRCGYRLKRMGCFCGSHTIFRLGGFVYTYIFYLVDEIYTRYVGIPRYSSYIMVCLNALYVILVYNYRLVLRKISIVIGFVLVLWYVGVVNLTLLFPIYHLFVVVPIMLGRASY